MRPGHTAVAILVGPLAVMLALMMAGGSQKDSKPPKAPTSQVGAGINDNVPEQYRPMIEKAATVCPEITAPLIAAQLAQESSFNPTAVSDKDARGIAQFLPSTWATSGKDGDGDGVADIWSPADAIWSQAHYMCNNVNALHGLTGAGRVSGDIIDLALAAYNAGLGAVIRFGGVPPYDETTLYIETIKSRMADFEAPAPAAPGPAVGQEGWNSPASGPITSPFGYRIHPILGQRKLHEGTDLAGGGCWGPIYAANTGKVTFAGMDEETGTVTIAHGGGLTTSYLHVPENGILVHVGDTVTAGQKIAQVGKTGWATACHLHFEVRLDGVPTDPVPFMAERGVNLG